MIYMVLVFLLITVSPVFSYIDPGTGSMLFSAVTGLAVVVYFFFKNVFIKIKHFGIFSKKENIKTDTEKKSFVIFSEGKQYWNVFKPVVEEFSNRNLECVYYTCDENDPGLDFKSETVFSEFLGSGFKPYAKMNMLEADVVLMTTPGLDVYHLKRSPKVKHYSFILHAVTDATLHRLFGLDYYDSILITGEFQKKSLKKLEELRNQKDKILKTVGCTYLDVLNDKLSDLPKSGNYDSIKTVLVSPSWGSSGLLSRFGLSLLKPLADTGYQIIIRPHPQSFKSEIKMINKLKNDLKDYGNIEWDRETENLISMERSDIMISDFSGIIFDYYYLFNKPVIYPDYEIDLRLYDAGDLLKDDLWIFKALKSIGYEIDRSNFDNVGKIIEEALSSGNSVKEEWIEAGWCCRGKSGIATVDFLEKIRETDTVNAK